MINLLQINRIKNIWCKTRLLIFMIIIKVIYFMICLPNSKSTELNPLVKFIMTRIGAYVHRSFVSKIKNVIGKIKEGLRTNLYIYTSIYFFNQSGKNSDYVKKLRTNLHT
jgi:hypothetical protein